MTKNHWAQAYFRSEIGSIISLTEGKKNPTDLVILVDETRWVCKLLGSQSWLGNRANMELELTEQFADEVSNRLGYTFSAFRDFHQRSILTLNQSRGLIIPFCEGEILSQFSLSQAMILGYHLAGLHSLKLRYAEANPFPAINFPDKRNPPRWVKELILRSNKYRYCGEEQWVFSHRDIYAANIVWRSDERPHFIDWESAGLIHPFVELIGLALNNAGLATCIFDAEQFYATIKGYWQYSNNLPRADVLLWEQIYHSWLLWYVYCLAQVGEVMLSRLSSQFN